MESESNLVHIQLHSEASLRSCQSCQNCERMSKWRSAWIALVREIRRYGGDAKWPAGDAAGDMVRCTVDDLQIVKLDLPKQRTAHQEMKSNTRIVNEMHTKHRPDESSAVSSLKCYLGNASTKLIHSMRLAKLDETIITTLRFENRVLNSKFQNLIEVMRMGYKELCKFLDEPDHEMCERPPAFIAREIIDKSCKHYLELQSTVKEIKLLRQTCVGMQNKLRKATVALEDLRRKNLQLEAKYLSLNNFHCNKNIDINNSPNQDDSITASYDHIFPAEVKDFEYGNSNVVIIDLKNKQNYISVLQQPTDRLRCKIGEHVLNNNREYQLSIIHTLLDKQDLMLHNLKMITEEITAHSIEDVTLNNQLEAMKSNTTILLYPPSTKSRSDGVVSLEYRGGSQLRSNRRSIASNTLNVLRNNCSISKFNRLNIFSLSDNCFNFKSHGNKEKSCRRAS